ncbi:MAG: SGNH/GDSL hydrolase family protein [Gemmatimonadaceae bacterium]
MRFSHYLALGDSMSIDLYPALDVGQTAVAVNLERDAQAGGVAPLGAASLLVGNDDERWPEFAGRDLRSRFPGIGVTNLAADGATVGEVFADQIPELVERDDAVLVTLTVGGNDLLSAFAVRQGARGRDLMPRIVRDITHAYELLVADVVRTLPNATLVLTTVYDPSDGTGLVPGLFEDAGALPLEHLAVLNDHIRRTAADTPGARLADVHGHFLGHGVSAPEAERYYWRRSLIEPSALGASEIRRAWLEAIGL